MTDEMTQEIAVTSTQTPAKFNKGEIDLIRNSVAQGLTDGEMALFLYTSNERGLNPLLKQIYAIKRNQKQKDGSTKEVMTIQTGIDGFRLLAERTRAYAPSPKPTLYEYRNGRLFSATVFGMKLIGSNWVEFSATAITDEYKVDTNPIWQKMLHSQTEKCAEAKMLRRGWPEQFGGMYIHEEMQQADITTTTVISASLPEPQAQSDLPSVEAVEKCPVHDIPWHTFKGKGGASWQSHKNEDGTYCNKNKLVLPPPAADLKKPSASALAVESVAIMAETPELGSEAPKAPSREDYQAGCKAAQEVLQWSKKEHEAFLAPYGVVKYGDVTVAQRSIVLAALNKCVNQSAE